MQVGGSAIPRRRRLNVLVAIGVITATVALLVWTGALARSEVGTEDAGAGSAVIHDDPWKLRHDAEADSAVVHDDAGNVHPD